MKYKTFRNLALFGVLGAGALGVWGLNKLFVKKEAAVAPAPAVASQPASQPAPAVLAPTAAPLPAAAASAPAPATASDPSALRAMDEEILARVAQNIPGDKVKDAFSGKPYKVNLYKDAGQAGVNRLKIDLNRNEKWEEKWSFSTEGGQRVVKRQVAPNDDEKYTEEYRLDGKRWVKK